MGYEVVVTRDAEEDLERFVKYLIRKYAGSRKCTE